MAVPDPSRLLRWSRWGVVATAHLMAAALVITAWLGYTGARDASMIVARGQGHALIEGIIGRLRAVPSPPQAADMADILAALETTGLRYVEVSGRTPVHAGTAMVPSNRTRARPAGPEPLLLETAGSRVRMAMRLPPPKREHRRRGPLGTHSAQGPALRGPPPSGPPLFIEFEPGPATALVARAHTSLIISASVATALIATAWALFVWLRRRESDALQRARERHLATLGEMSAVLAHELRNPLASLKGHAQLLAESLAQEPKKRDKAGRVVAEAKRLERLTTDLLDFVRTAQIRRTSTDPVAVLHRAVAEIASDRIVVDTRNAPARWSIDPDRLQQALANLLRNAVHAASTGTIDATVSTAANILVFEVRDRGDGIPSAQLDHVFEPFHTTKVRGTGLGLAVVRRVVELHGGSVTADNHPEGGARFRITIPEVV